MAWRDSRFQRKKLFFFMSSIILGTAALVAISSLGENLQQAIDSQSRTLLGADLSIRSQREFPPEVEALFDSLGGEQSRQTSFTSMAFFPKNNSTRLSSIRALGGDFPYYGELVTTPPEASETFRTQQQALVDAGLMIQFGLEVGDSVKIGTVNFGIAGRLEKIPGEAIANSLVGPRIYFPIRYLDETDLIQPGSLATHYRLFKFAAPVNPDSLRERMTPYRNKYGITYETVERRRARLGRAMENLYRFLNLVGFIALLLGSIGVASAIHVYIKQKLSTIAILHCIGAETRKTFLIYSLQACGMGFLGASLGAALGLLIQLALPEILGDFIPVEVELSISWTAVVKGLTIAVSIAFLFAALPLLSVRKISPLLAIRSSVDETATTKDPLRWVAYFFILAAITVFSITQTPRLGNALGFVGALIAAFGLLAGTAKLIVFLIKRFFPSNWRYTSRQGLANLYRPGNQTLIMMVSLGLGVFLITTLYLTQNVLLHQVSLSSIGNQPNMVFFDVQSDQKEGVKDILKSHSLPILQQVPIVTMRLAEVNGRTTEEILADSNRTIRRWVLRREYRCSYRDSLSDTETVVAGAFYRDNNSNGDSIFVSLEDGIAEDLEVGIGDPLKFNVQGIPIQTYVGSIRTVDWQRVQPNFFVLFPSKVLESAPQFHVLVTRVNSRETSAAVQREAVAKYPNVSAIDLTLILDTVDAILNKVAFVIRFMALFSILTGITVLIGAVLTSRFQRIRESVLLRTLGADKRQVTRIMILEYAFLGGIAALTGLLLSIAGSWGLAFFVFEVNYIPVLWPLVIVFALVIGLTVLLGMMNSRGVVNRPPLEILRSEV